MGILLRTYRFLNILSIDVAIGAVCCALFFARVFQVHILPSGLVCLGFIVWIIYTADHLLDARKIGIHAATQRHQFHQQHFKVLSVCLALAGIVAGISAMFIRERVLIGGLILGSGVMLYLVALRHVKFLKELLIAIMYTIGVLLPSLALTSLSMTDFPWIVILQFSLTALLNLLLFSWFDYENDRSDNTISFATLFGKKVTKSCIILLFVLVCILLPFSTKIVASAFILSIAAIHMFLLAKYVYFKKSERFRLIGDALFLLSIFYWYP